LDITYVSMHSIQRRMQTEGLGQEAAVDHLESVERNLRLDQFRATWESRILDELAQAWPMNARQLKFLLTRHGLRHGTLATLWLTDVGLCYVVSENAEVVTVFGIDNAAAATLERLQHASPANANRAEGLRRDSERRVKPSRRCGYKECQFLAQDNGFCERHPFIGPAYARDPNDEVGLAEARVQDLKLAAEQILNKIAAAQDAERTTVEPVYVAELHASLAKADKAVSKAVGQLEGLKSKIARATDEEEEPFVPATRLCNKRHCRNEALPGSRHCADCADKALST